MTNYRHVSPDIMSAALKVSKPDPLVEVLKGLGCYDAETDAADLRAALDARGLEIRDKNK